MKFVALEIWRELIKARDFHEGQDVIVRVNPIVYGALSPSFGIVDAPIGRHPKHDYKFAVMGDGKHSVTHYETLEAHRFASLLEIHLETGRTHQIRVHCAFIGHPVVALSVAVLGAMWVFGRTCGFARARA